jgi:hypothetical protein
MHALPPLHINHDTILALVALEAHVGFPLGFEVTFFCGDALLATKQGIATEVFVALLGKAKAGFVPDKAVVHQLGERGVDVALALEQFVPLDFLPNHANRSTDPVMHPEGIISLEQNTIVFHLSNLSFYLLGTVEADWAVTASAIVQSVYSIARGMAKR